MWTRYLLLIVLGALLRFDYEAHQPSGGVGPGPPLTHASRVGDRNLWAEKAVINYARAQRKKWRNWDEAMFESRPNRVSQTRPPA